MHLIQTQSLSAGAPIGTPLLPIDYVPIFDTPYITLQPYTKPSKTYDYWVEVIELLLPVLKANNIQIVQLGGQNEQALPGCVHYQGLTSIAQTNYIVKNALLHLGADSWIAHAAGVFNIPIVCLYSNNKINNVKPYWGDASKQKLLTGIESGMLPSYALEEFPKTINNIKPEDIANSVFDLLSFPEKVLSKTIKIGPLFTNKFVEWIPNCVINPQRDFAIDTIICRYDKHQDLQNLAQQVQISHVNIISDKEIDLGFLNTFKSRIPEFIYIVTENNNPQYVKQVQKLGITVRLMSYLDREAILKDVLNYSEIGVINLKKSSKVSGANRFKTNKIIVDKGGLYASFAHQRAGINLLSINNIIDSEELWLDHEFFYFLD